MIDEGAVLRAAGLTVVDARVDPRPGAYEPFAVLWHHTGTRNPPAAGRPASLRVCQQGRQDVPGPLCQWLVNPTDLAWWWVTAGKANHAGRGARTTLAWLRQTGLRPDNPPPPTADDYAAGNRYYCGIEVEGTGHWSAAAAESMLVGTRALLEAYASKPDNLIAHREHTRRKTDPAGVDMAAARARLRQPTSPVPPTEENDDMPRLVHWAGADYLVGYDMATGRPVRRTIPNLSREAQLVGGGGIVTKPDGGPFLVTNDQFLQVYEDIGQA